MGGLDFLQAGASPAQFSLTAVLSTTLSGISRAGFSIVQIDSAGAVIGACCGIVPLNLAPLQQARDIRYLSHSTSMTYQCGACLTLGRR